MVFCMSSVVKSAFAFGALTLGAVALSGRSFSAPNEWYTNLDKPRWNPPSKVFGPVWTTLYGLMSLSAARVYAAPKSLARRRALALWSGQLALNALWSPTFFARHDLRGSLVNVLGQDALLVGYTATAARVDKRAAWLIAPLVGWVGFATLLNANIARRNV